MYGQPMHLSYESIFYIQNTRGRVDFYGYPAEKSPCWFLQPSSTDLLFSVAIPSFLDLAIFVALHSQAQECFSFLMGCYNKENPKLGALFVAGKLSQLGGSLVTDIRQHQN